MSQEILSETQGEEPDADTIVEVRDLKTYYGGGGLLGGNPVKAVDGVNLDIHRGETLGLVGESGCGKTTLGRTLLRLETPTAGEVRFDGTDITSLNRYELKEWRRNAQMVFQDPDSSLNDRMTVGEIVREPLDVYDWKTPEERRKRVKYLLDTVGLQSEHYYRYPHQFSGGQRQRVGIARTLTLEPEFIVLDEPVSALDVSVQAEVINLLENLQDEFGLTYLFIAHDLSVVRHISDRVAVMYLGNIMEIGETEELFTNPSNPYTQSLLSAIPEPDPGSEKRRITLRGTPPNPRYPPSGCPFRTRCPVRIRPEEYADLDEEVWDRLNQFEEVLKERYRSRGIGTKLRERIGLSTRYRSSDEITSVLFESVTLPQDVEAIVEEIAVEVDSGNDEAALDRFQDAFMGPCGNQRPENHTVSGDGHKSLCHRHREEYSDPETVMEDRNT